MTIDYVDVDGLNQAVLGHTQVSMGVGSRGGKPVMEFYPAEGICGDTEEVIKYLKDHDHLPLFHPVTLDLPSPPPPPPPLHQYYYHHKEADGSRGRSRIRRG